MNSNDICRPTGVRYRRLLAAHPADAIVAIFALALALALPLAFVLLMVGPAAAQTLEVTVNPYEGIDWQAAGHHKANFHTHTTESDGRLSPAETIDKYHQLGYSILAVTDHNRSTYPWQRWNRAPAELGMIAIAGNELSRHHHALSLFSDFDSDERDVHVVLDQLTAYSQHALAVICHPAMHWPRQFGAELGLRTPLAPALQQITRGDFTIEAWFRTTDAGRNILWGNFSTQQPGSLNLELHTENRVRVFVQPAAESKTVDLNVAVGELGIETRNGQWHHLAGVRRQGTVSLFLNGKEIGSRPDTAGSYDLQGAFYYLGRDTRTGSTTLDGDLDQVRLWTRGLMADEVARLASGGGPGRGVSAEGLLIQYAFETSQASPVRGGDRAGSVVDDTAGHPQGPFHATAGDTAPLSYLAEVAEPLADAGASSHGMRFRTQEDLQKVPEAAVQYYVDLFTRYDRLVGIEVLNATRPLREYPLDRELWDKLLAHLMPERPVWGLATDDMHSMVHLGRDWLVFPGTGLDTEAVRLATIRGAFYFCTTRLHDPDQAAVERTPRIQSVTHDAQAGTITVRAAVEGQPLDDAAYQWISAGVLVHTGPSLRYRALDGLGNYARLEICGSGGTTYTNPFGFRTAASTGN